MEYQNYHAFTSTYFLKLQMNNPPTRHHFVPIFYTRRWADQDGQVCEFSRPYRDIKVRRVHPAGTGYLDRLYELRGFPRELAQQVETKFFSRIDSQAADALTLMESHGNDAMWTPAKRKAWTTMIFAMLFRGPEAIRILKDNYLRDLYAPDHIMEARYSEIREHGEPDTFVDFLKSQGEAHEDKIFFELITRLMEKPMAGHLIHKMAWHVIELPDSKFELLTSDQPVIMTRGLAHQHSHLAMPLGPRRLWLAANNQHVLSQLSRASSTQLAREVNTLVVEQAQRYVYAANDRQLAFVQRRFGARADAIWIARVFANDRS